MRRTRRNASDLADTSPEKPIISNRSLFHNFFHKVSRVPSFPRTRESRSSVLLPASPCLMPNALNGHSTPVERPCLHPFSVRSSFQRDPSRSACIRGRERCRPLACIQRRGQPHIVLPTLYCHAELALSLEGRSEESQPGGSQSERRDAQRDGSHPRRT